MAASLPTITGQNLAYNNVIFDALYTTKINGEVVYDDARRMVKFVRWTILVSAKVTVPVGNTSTDIQLNTLRQALTAPGKIFTYQSKGFGDMIINHPAIGVWDAEWGPKPELLSFVPIGNQLAAIVEWRCTVAIPQCPDPRYRNAVLMLNYDVQWSIPKHGYQVVSYSGALEVPLTWSLGDNVLPDHADNYRNLCAPPIPPRFQREQRYHLSNDRRRLDFNITDTELPVPLPKGTTLCNFRHRVGSRAKQLGFVQWENNISGTIVTVPQRPKASAWDIFYNIVATRMGQTIRSRRDNGAGNCAILLTAIEADEDIFGIETRFSASYVGIGYTLASILDASGLFQPTSAYTGSFNDWKKINDQTAGDIRGNLGLSYGTKDIFVDLCFVDRVPPPRAQIQTPPSPPPTNPSRNRTASQSVVRRGGLPIPQGVNFNPPTPPGGGSGLIPPGASWLDYRCELQYREQDNTIIHKPLAGTVTDKSPGNSDLTNVANVLQDETREQFLVQKTVPDRIQRVASPTSTIKLVGSAIRFGNPIAAPRIETIGGQKATQTAQWIAPSILGAIQGIPVFGLRWEIDYLLTDIPKSLPLPANPALDTDGAPDLVDLIQG